MTKNVKTKAIKFDAELDNNGKVSFSGIHKVDVDNDNDGDYHFITFVLDDDDTGLNLRFRPLPSTLGDSPFWIQPIAQGCPQIGAEMKNVVEPLFVSPNGRELTVVNYNAKVEEMRFALRLVDKAGAGHDYDPIMNNQNGGRSFEWATAAAITAVALSVGAIAYVGLRGGIS